MVHVCALVSGVRFDKIKYNIIYLSIFKDTEMQATKDVIIFAHQLLISPFNHIVLFFRMKISRTAAVLWLL